jgi:Tol biopolymer transport system component
MFLIETKDILAGKPRPPVVGPCGCGVGCNEEISRDGKWLVHCVDDSSGSHLHYDSLDPAVKKSGNVELGWQMNKTASYFPDFSPDVKYLVYAHWDTESKDWYQSGVNGDLFVSRWPADGVSVRITWHGGFTQHPQWWGPKNQAGDQGGSR